MSKNLDITPIFNFKTALKDFISLFFKIFGIRAVYSILQIIIGKKNGLNLRKVIISFLGIFIGSKTVKNFNLISLLVVIFTWSNLRTSISISMLPFIYKVLKLTFKNIYGKEIYPKLTTFIFGFTASYLSIIFVEKTKFVDFIILSILVRVIHLIILEILKKFDILQNNGRKYDYFNFLISALSIWSIFIFNPGFKSITNLIDKYAHYPSKESYEYLASREILNTLRIV